MNLLLVHPPLDTFVIPDSSAVFPTIGLGYLKSFLTDEDFGVYCLDPYTWSRHSFQEQDSTFLEHVERKVRDHHPSIVGITSISHTRHIALDIARIVKRIHPDATLVFGGPHATFQWDQLLTKYPDLIDYIVRGEGELAFRDLVLSLKAGKTPHNIKGVAYNRDGRLQGGEMAPQVPVLDVLPYPDYGTHAAISQDGQIPTLGVVASRGCPYTCRFCVSPRFWGRKVRLRSPTSVVDELQHYHARYGTTTFKFQDDTFTEPRERALAIFNEISRRKMNANLYMHTRIELVDKELLAAFRKAGGVSIFFGLESGSQHLRKTMGKGSADIHSIVTASRLMREFGIALGVFVMLGYPGETIDDVRDTSGILDSIKPDDIFITTAKVLPGTPLTEQAKQMGIYNERDWLDDSNPYFAFVDHDSKYKAFIHGCLLLFDEQYRRRQLRSDYENNQEVSELRQSSIDCEALKSHAIKILAGGNCQQPICR